MPTTTTKTISNTITADYSTPQSWEDDCVVDLVAADIVWRGEIIAKDSFTDTTGFVVTFFGGTTDATHYKELTVRSGYSFADNRGNPLRYDASKGASISVTSGQCIRIDEAYARVSRVQCYATTAATPILVLAAGRGSILNRIIMGSENFNGQFRATTVSTKVTNSLFVGRTGGIGSFVSTSGAGALVDFYNCAFVVPSDKTANNHISFVDTGSTMTFTNCAFFNTTATAVNSGTGTITFTTCFGDHGTPPTGYTTVTYASASYGSTTNAASDFRIGSGSSLKDVGTTSATYASTDIYGTGRPTGSAYDVGPHEFDASAGRRGSLMLMGVGT